MAMGNAEEDLDFAFGITSSNLRLIDYIRVL